MNELLAQAARAGNRVPSAGLERWDRVETQRSHGNGLRTGHNAASKTVWASLEFDIANESQGGSVHIHIWIIGSIPRQVQCKAHPVKAKIA